MSKQYQFTFVAALVCMALASGVVRAQSGYDARRISEQNAGHARLTIHADQSGPLIHREIYGQFAEHLGRCIYDGIWVGPKSSIPNIDGYRKDVLDALKAVQIPDVRWPGGCFADTYHWKDGIGPQEQRRPIVNVTWGMGTEDNSFGTREFIHFCRLIGTQPYLAGNVGSGEVQELADWVQYCNKESGGQWATLRKAYGDLEPFNVRLWGIGNETWGCGGNMTPDYYADEYLRYATFVHDYDKTKLFRVASGSNGDDYNWMRVMMRRVGPTRMEGLSLHLYNVSNWSHKGSAVDYDESGYIKTLIGAAKMDAVVTSDSIIMDQYDPQNKVALVVDEWGNWWDPEPNTNASMLYQQNTMRDAISAAVTLNILNKHADRVRMANIAQMVNVLQSLILTEGNKMLKTPTYHVFDLYRPHQDATLLPTELTTPDYVLDNAKFPAVSATVSKSSDGAINITLCNCNPHAFQAVDCNLAGADLKSGSGRVLSTKSIRDLNTFEQPDAVHLREFTDFKLDNAKLNVNLPPLSIVTLTLH